MFCVGPPYRKPLYSNRWLVLALVGLSAFSIYTLFMPPRSPVFRLLQFVDLPHDFHLELLLILLANVALSWIFEDVGAQALARWIGDMQRRYRRMRGRRKESGKAYKAISRCVGLLRFSLIAGILTLEFVHAERWKTEFSLHPHEKKPLVDLYATHCCL